MTTFNTGNPIGSTDARDLSDNAKNMDYLENSTTKLTHPDRLGTVRKTRHGMEAEHDAQIAAHEAEHDAQMQSFENDFDGRLAGMAFTRVGSFTTGATLTDMRQVLIWEVSQGGDGHEYGWAGAFPKVVAAGATPATSGGIGAGAWVDRTDVTLRTELTSMFDASSLADFSGLYGISLSSLTLWSEGETVSIGAYRIYNNSVWAPVANSTVCGAIPSFGQFYKLSPDKKIYVENCGDISTSDDTAAIINAIAAAKSANINEVIVNYNLQPSSAKISGAGDIFWRGRGSLGDLYGVFVENENTEDINFNCKLDNLPALTSSSNPVVVVVGDSIFSYKPDALNTSQTLYELIVQKFSQSFTNKNFSFYNRAIGGQTIGNFDTTSLSNVDAPWYTVGTPWINYVSSLAPDVVILHFGMNDTTESTLAQYISVIDKLQAFTKVPDIILCTNMTPSRENTYATFGTLETQLNRELTAGVQRGVSAFKGLSLIDFNRQFHGVRDGYDIRNSAMRNIHLNIAAPASAYTSDVKTYSDFSFTLLSYETDNNAISNMFNRSLSTGVPFCIKTGPGYTDTVFLTNRNTLDVATGTLWLRFFCGSPAQGHGYDTVDTGLAIPAGPFTLNVSARDNTFTVSFGAGDPDKVFKYTTLIRNGGWFYPKYGYWSDDTIATIIDFVSLDIGIPKKVKKQITDSELFGFDDGSAGIKYPNGGNGINHPSSLGISRVFRALLDRCELAQSPESTIVQITDFSNGFVATAAYGTVIHGIKHPDGTITIDGQVSNNASSLNQGAVICTLPPEIRPSFERWISSATYNSTTLTFDAGTVQYNPISGTLNYLSGNINVIGINFTFKK